MALKLYITVKELLGNKEFEMITDVDPELPLEEFVDKIKLIKLLDKDYPDWQSYEIDIDLKEKNEDIPDIDFDL